MHNKTPHPSNAIEQSESTTLESMLKPFVSANQGLSGFHIFEKGTESLDGRLFLIQAAEKTLDLQYYAVSDGISSNLLIETLVRAADRGVRVRLLVDDITTGPMRRTLSALDDIKNVEIRVFNPINKHDQSPLARFFAFITHTDRATRRMHNKALIADNQMAIIGGRNLGDEYFDTHEEMSFKDIDVLSAGPITADISRSFDEFWNDPHTYPIYTLHHFRAGAAAVRKIREKLRKNWNRNFEDSKSRDRLEFSPNAVCESILESLVWAKADLVADPSAKVMGEDTLRNPLRHLKELVDKASLDFIIISAYFVPREKGVEWLTSLAGRGIAVKILTNSLASTDVVAVHTGYSPYRTSLLEKGISIFELKPRGAKRTRQRLIGRRSPSYASLHAKAYIVDNEYAVVGSFNFDPRSAFLNTELGLFIQSPELALQLRKMFDESCKPGNSYKIGLAPGKKLIWASREDGQEIRYVTEPKASPWRVLQVFLIGLLPVEKQL